MEVVDDPIKWADRCFEAINMRQPNTEIVGEKRSMYRDLDLDGIEERLEIRGTGKQKQIYTFRVHGQSYSYTGVIIAHPSFFIARDENNDLVLLNIYRAGFGEVYLQYIQFKDDEFIVTRQDRMQ